MSDFGSVDQQIDGDRWLAWPRCPICEKRRQTFCRTCDLAGEDFPLAEYIPISEPIGSTGSEMEDSKTGSPLHRCCGGGSCGGSATASNSECSEGRGVNAPNPASGPEADRPVDGALPVLLFCPACNEAFSPKFFRLCAQCGHDFGEGREVAVARPSELNDRVLIALVALGALAVSLVAYFWMLFQS